jgi:hypothetical protein
MSAILDTMRQTVSALTENERIASILPQTPAQLQQVLHAATSWTSSALADALATQASVLTRSVDWIRQEGMCLDHIVPKPSTIPGAGKGAFAQRPLQEGERIVPVPLVHFGGKDRIATPLLEELEEDSHRQL